MSLVSPAALKSMQWKPPFITLNKKRKTKGEKQLVVYTGVKVHMSLELRRGVWIILDAAKESLTAQSLSVWKGKWNDPSMSGR